MKTSFLKIFMFVFFLVGCQAAPALPPTTVSRPTAQPTFTYFPSLEPYPTYTFYPTYTAAPPQEITVVVTAAPTLTREQIMKSDKKANGGWLVNYSIAPGWWRPLGDNEHCRGNLYHENYEREDFSGTDLVYIAPTDKQFDLQGCGTWTYLAPPDELYPTLTPIPTLESATADKGPGGYHVPYDIAPGRWRSNGTGDDCRWSRNFGLSFAQADVKYNGKAGGTVDILPADSFFWSQGCGTWTYIGPPD